MRNMDGDTWGSPRDLAELDAWITREPPENDNEDCLAAGAEEPCGRCDACERRRFEDGADTEEAFALVGAEGP